MRNPHANYCDYMLMLRKLPPRLLALGVLLTIAKPSWTSGQAFNSGSDGSYGALNVTVTTNLAVPPNGIFNCTTITIASGQTLNFTRNALNTPVYLLATSNVVINGVINVSGGGSDNGSGGGAGGPGGPGGFPGGDGGYLSVGNDGSGPGAGRYNNNSLDAVFGNALGVHVYGNSVAANSNLYGNVLLYPLIGGSGGAGGYQPVVNHPGPGGGGGGGAILIAANTSVTIGGSGAVVAYGGGAGQSPYNTSIFSGNGSGGAIRIVAPVVTGTGVIDVRESNVGNNGRIRIDCTDNISYRNLGYYGNFSRGSQMFVFPPVVSSLSIVQAAGQVIPEGTNNSVLVSLPAGSPTNQTVTVLARNFTNDLPIVVSVVPKGGQPSSNYLATIVMTNNPSQVTVNVTIPSGPDASGGTSLIYAWTQ